MTIEPLDLSKVTKVAAHVPVSEELLCDQGWQRNAVTFRAETFGGFINGALDRMLAPWKYADRAAMPTIDIFPRLTRWTNRARTVAGVPRRVRRRIRDVVDVARHGLPPERDDW